MGIFNVSSRPVRPSSGQDGTDYSSWFVFLGVLERNTPGKVRPRWTVGGYSPIYWTSGTSPSWNHTPPNESLYHHETSLVPSPLSHNPLPSPHRPRRAQGSCGHWAYYFFRSENRFQDTFYTVLSTPCLLHTITPISSTNFTSLYEAFVQMIISIFNSSCWK